MAQSSSSKPIDVSNPMRLTLIVAATKNLGIGKNGSLPWRLKNEMQYFARVTSRVTATSQQAEHGDTSRDASQQPQNAVIMGRKTWDSIPAKFKPLKGRVNVVLSSSMAREEESSHTSTISSISTTAGVQVARTMDEALSLLKSQSNRSINRVFIIGGHAVYKAALERAETNRVLLTRVDGDQWDCDTFFPVDLEAEAEWKRTSVDELKEWTGEEGLGDGREKEGEVEYEYCMYVKGA